MGILTDVNTVIEQSDNTVRLLSELSLLPNSEHGFSLFKKTYLDAKEIWLYSYRFECPNILKKLNDIVNSNTSNFCTKFNGFEITVAVCCNSINHGSLRNCARVTCTLEITNERGYKKILNQHESTYSPRANLELFADSLFRIELANITGIFESVDSIYGYLDTIDRFRGYNLAY